MEVLQLGPYTSGEIPVPVVVQFTDNDDNPIDLSGFQVRFVYRERGAASATERIGALEDPATGKARYTWVAADLETAGNYEAEMWVGNVTNRYASLPIRYHVRANLGVVPAI